MSASRFLKTLTAAGLLLAAASGAPAQQAPAKATPPAPAPAKEVRFPEFQEKTLANGLRVVVIEQHEQPAVSLRLLMPTAGKTFEPADKAGVAEATGALLTKGTATRSSQQIAEAIDFVGGGLFAGANLESGTVSASVTSDQLDLAFELMADVLLHPSFPQDEIDRWRRQTLNGLQVQYQDAGYLAGVALGRVLYGDHPYGRPDDGTPQSIQSLTRDDLVAFHKRTYIPANALLAVVGDVKPADAFARAEKAFGGWPKAEAPGFPAVQQSKTAEGRRILVIDKPDAVQTEIRLGQIALPYRDPNHFAAQVYNSVVGANASARLFDEIRRKRGLSYGAGSDFMMPTLPGWYEVSTNTKTETTVEALDVALEVLGNVPKQPIAQQELSAAKTYMTGAFPLMIETPDGIGEQVLDAMRHGYGRDWLENYNARISQVTAADVQKFARERIHPDKMAVVLVGNASAFSEALKKKYGAFETIPAAEVDFLQASLRKAKAEQQPAASAADQTRGLELLRKAQQALGGAAFTGQKTQIVKGSGSVTFPGMPQAIPVSSMVIYRVLPDKERTELTLPMGTMVQVQSGKQAWMSLGPQVQDMSAQMGEQNDYGFDVLRLAGQDGYTARPLPDAEVEGKAAKVVELADAQGHATRFFIDPATNLVVKLEYDANGEKPEIFFSDYRDVSGVKVPYKTRVTQNGEPLMEMNSSEVQVNAAVDGKLFEKPQG